MSALADAGRAASPPGELARSRSLWRRDDLLGQRGRLVVGVLFAVLYVLTFGLRGNLLAGIVSGVLGGVVVYLLLKQADDRRRRRQRRDGSL